MPRFKLLLNQLNKDALSRELIKYVSISYYYSQPLPLVSLLSLLRGDGFEISEEQLLDHANSKLDGEIIISELDEDTVFRLRHETIASAFLQNMKISSARKSELLMHMLVHMIEQGQASFASKLLNTALINISSADFIKLLERRGTKKFIVVAVNSSYPNFECLLKNIDDETLKKKVLKKRVLDLDAVSTKRGDSDVSFLVAKLFMDEVRSNITNSELDTVALTKSLIGPTNVRYMSNEHNLLVLLNAVTGVHAVSIGTLTRFLLHTGKVDVALKVWELISQNNNEFVHTYISILNLGAVYLEVGDLKSASLLYQQHLELTRSSQKLWRRYIEVLIKQNFDAAHSEISLFEAKHGAPAKYLFLELYIRFKQVKEISEIRNHIIKNPGGGVTQKVWLLASSLCLNESKIEDIYIFIWDVLIRLKSFNQRSETNVNFIRTALKCCICPEDKQNIVTLGLINYLSDWGENQAVENEAKVFQEIDIFLTGIWTEISLGNKLSNELFHFLIAVKSLNMKSHKLQKLSELISQSSSLMDTSFEKIHPLNLFPIACICFHIGSMELSNSFFSAASRAVKTSPSFYYEWASLCKKAGFSYAEQKYLLAIDAEKLQTPKSIEGLTAFMMEHGDRRDFEKAMEILLVNQA